MTSRFYSAVFFVTFISRVFALLAIQGSPCYDSCQGDSPLNQDGIVCTDTEFGNTTQGQVLQNCLTCLQHSDYAQGNQTDQFYFLFYLTLVQKICLDEPETVPLSYCSTKCDFIANALSESFNQTWFQNPYEYCSDDSSEYVKNAPNCGTCLQSQEGSVVVGNFVVVGNVVCQSKPELWDGQNVTFNGNIFNSETLPATLVGTNTPISTAAASRTGKGGKPTVSSSATIVMDPSASSSASSTSTAQSANSSSGHAGINSGVAAGIGLFVGLAGVAGVAAFAIFARKRRKGALKRAGRPWKRDAKPAMATTGVNKPLPAIKGQPNRRMATRMTPRTSAWYWAANPKSSTDLSALPQKDWR